MGRVSIAITIEFYVTVFALRSWLIIEMSIKMVIGKEREREIERESLSIAVVAISSGVKGCE